MGRAASGAARGAARFVSTPLRAAQRRYAVIGKQAFLTSAGVLQVEEGRPIELNEMDIFSRLVGVLHWVPGIEWFLWKVSIDCWPIRGPIECCPCLTWECMYDLLLGMHLHESTVRLTESKYHAVLMFKARCRRWCGKKLPGGFGRGYQE